jgi:exportin-2 (importin alpha re-exporter)
MFTLSCRLDILRDTLKTNLIDLMCSTPPDVQKQLAEAVAIIAKYDFPSNWQSLIPHLVSKLASSDILTIKGVMLTANGIFKRFRNVHKSDELYAELVVCLTGFQAPLTQIYCATSGAVAALGGSKDQLCIVFETLRLMTRIFYSLNWQDIPEYFEDNIASWMEEFAKYLSYKNPLLVDDREEAGPIESLQTAVIENLNLYASKYEEEFAQHLGQFTQAVWQLLVEVGQEPKYDALATSGIKFLTSVSSKEVNRALFS